MAVSTLRLSFDVVNQAIVAYNGTPSALPQLRQNTYPVKIFLVQPNTSAVPGGQQVYVPYDGNNLVGFRMGIWSASTGTLGDSDNFKLAFTPEWEFTYDPADGSYNGTFDCHTVELGAQIGAAASGDFFFAAGIVTDGQVVAVYDQKGGKKNCTVNAATDEGGNAATSVINNIPTFKTPVQFTGNGRTVAINVGADGSVTWTIIV